MNTIEAVNGPAQEMPASQPNTAETAAPKTKPDNQAPPPAPSKDDQAKMHAAVAKDGPEKAAAPSTGGQASGVELGKRAI
jgi:hypothetical protein